MEYGIELKNKYCAAIIIKIGLDNYQVLLNQERGNVEPTDKTHQNNCIIFKNLLKGCVLFTRRKIFSENTEQYFHQVIKISINEFLRCDTLKTTHHFSSILAGNK